MSKKLLIVMASISVIIGSIAIFIKYNSNNSDPRITLDKIYQTYLRENKLDSKDLKKLNETIRHMSDGLDKEFLVGFSNYANGNNKEAKKYFKLVSKEFSRSTDPLIKIYTGKFLAQINIEEGNDKEAINVVKNTFDSIPKGSYEELLEHIWGLLYPIGYLEGGYDLIIYALNDIMSIDRNLGKEQQLYIYERLSSVHRLKRNYSQAVYLTAKAIALAKDQGDDFKESVLKIDLASMIFQFDEYARAEKLIKEALQVNIEGVGANAESKVYAISSLMEAYVKLEQYDDVLKYGKQLPQYEDDVDWDIYNDISILGNIFMAQSYMHKGDLNRAKQCLDEVEEIFKTDEYIFFWDKEIYYYEALGQYDEAIGNYENAIKNYEKALKESNEKEVSIKKLDVLERLFSLYDKQGDREQEDKYQKLLIAEYKNNKNTRNEENVSYILEKVDSEEKMLERAKKELAFYKVASIIVFLATLIFVFLGMQLRKSQKQSCIDGLTGVYNRHYFDIIYNKYIERKEKFSVMMVDIDNFKAINDTYGHEFGDTVIKGITETIGNLLDEEDKEFRYGGEEFIILIKDKPIEQVFKIAEKIRSAVESKVWKEDIVVTISLGVAEFKGDKNVVEIADKNLYMAKKIGKNKVV